MKPTDRLIAPSRGSAAEALSNIVLPEQIDRAYVTEVYRWAPEYGIDAAIVVSQWHVETGGGTSPRWRLNGNPAGLLVSQPGDPDPATWDGIDAAHVHLWALAHACDPTLGPDWGFLPASAAYFVERWTAKYNDPNCPDVATVDDLNIRYNDAMGEPQATWAWDAQYQDLIVARSKILYPDLPDQTGGATVPTRPAVFIDAGHRSTDRSGNPAEMALTDNLAIAYVDELRRRGYEAYWYQRDLDADADPDETVGDLNTVAKGIGAWLAQQSNALFISCHYNGAHSPLHAIVPDNVHLSTAYPEGRDPNDTAANNPLDVRVGSEIVGRMAASGLGGLFQGKLGKAGIMSETETGVGLEGFRLAVMAATCPSRLTAVRLVIEHGGTADPAARRFADFARCAADGIDAVYGATPSTTTTAPPAHEMYPPHRIPAPDYLESQGHPLTENDPNRFLCVHGGRFKTGPSLDAPDAVKSPYRGGAKYTFDFEADVDGTAWLVSRAGSWAPKKNFRVA